MPDLRPLIHGTAWFAAGVSGLLTAACAWIVATRCYCWDVFGFKMIAIPAAFAVLLLAVAPNAALYERSERRKDGAYLLLAVGAFVVIAAQILLLHSLPETGE